MGLPTPEPGLVISYSYLWRREAERGQVEGLKDRLCAIVLVVDSPDDKFPVVSVVPSTHSAPADPSIAIEIPKRVKQHLGLDSERSWIILNELNVFKWPGFDLRPVPGSPSRFDYGFIPPVVFEQMKATIIMLAAKNRSTTVDRDQE